MEKTTYKILDWISRNTLIVAITVLIIAFLGFPKFVLDTIGVGGAVISISVILASIVIYTFTKFKFLEEFEIAMNEPDIVIAARIFFNAILRLCVVLIFGFVALSVAVSIFISQWRIDGAN